MSKISNIPGQEDPKFIKNENLLPAVFNTSINQKMLDSSLNLMTSKGKMLPFYNSYGTQNSTTVPGKFLDTDTDPVRKESQTNLAITFYNDDLEYQGKTSYLDIENYFNIKGLPLKDGTDLDDEVKVLQLPLNQYRLSDYQLYYWLPMGLAPFRIHVEDNGTGVRLSVIDQIIGKPYATVTDDKSGKKVNLASYQRIFFTGAVDSAFVSADPEAPDVYIVLGVGAGIVLIKESTFEKRTNTSTKVKIPWDEDSGQPPYMGKEWDASPWDSSRLLNLEPEYLVVEQYDLDRNPWSIINNWYHISRIREVCDFYDLPIEDYANEKNRAQRPIIQLRNTVKLYNWPTSRLCEVATALPGNTNKYSGLPLQNVKDKTGYVIPVGSLVVFAENQYVQRLEIAVDNGREVSKWVQTSFRGVNEAGVFITGSPALRYYSFIYKNNKWQPAQNKTKANQCPLVEIYDENGRSLADENVYYNSRFAGAKVLDFKEGKTYDPVLKRNVSLSDIEFDALPNVSEVLLSGPNQLQLYTDVDSQWFYDLDINEKATTGINYYRNGSAYSSFWTIRSGLDTTMPEQVIEFSEDTDNAFTAEIYSPVDGFNEIHVYENVNGEVDFYFQLKDYGLIQFTSSRESLFKELVLPILSSDLYNEYKIVCHKLSNPVALYENKLVDGSTRPILLQSPVVTNNNISDGTIIVNLESTYIDDTLTVQENPISKDDTKFLWHFNNSFRIAITRPIEKFKFITSAFLRDRTVQLYSDYDFRNATDSMTPTGQFVLEGLNKLNSKATNGDKIVVESPVIAPGKKTAPYALTSNPANASLSDIDYYSIYQHTTQEQGSAPNTREFLDPQTKDYTLTVPLGTGTIHKHNQPIGLFSLLATNAELDLVETINKQAKHYDTFMSRFKSELQIVVNRADNIAPDNWQSLITVALESIYVNQFENTFWHHSNMIGWGTDYKTAKIIAAESVSFADPIEPISYAAGKESLTHLFVNGVKLCRGRDYQFVSNIANYHTGVRFASDIIGQEVVIKQWPVSFSSRIPASLAKLGLTPLYMPEIYHDTTYDETSYFLIRHDGTRYFLEDGISEQQLPNNVIDALLFEYEKMIFSSISREVENIRHRMFLEKMPGYFRKTRQQYSDIVNLKNYNLVSWQIENNIFVFDNKTYDAANQFTYRYEMAEFGVSGSWRAIYKYFFDTDCPHTHPWEMLAFTVKPADWDSKYSWTDPVKKSALLKALAVGLRGQVSNVFFARSQADVDDDKLFPVDSQGNLLAPLEVDWIREKITNVEFDSNFAAGELSPQELVFASTQRGLASDVVARYLVRPLAYVNELWRPGAVVINRFGIKTTALNTGWNESKIDDVYHRSNDDCFTAGIEALLAEHYVLQNKDFYTDIVAKSRNKKIVKEFLLSGFTNKNNVRIQSTSINSQRQALYIAEENYDVRTVSHYKNKEFFYSGMRIIWNGTGWMIYGFVNEKPYFTAYTPSATSLIMPVTIGTFVAKEKENYDKVTVTYPYGYVFTGKQELYDFIKGYGLYLEDTGFIFDEIESDDIKNWQLSAKQFAFWAEDPLLPGNYLDLNPAAGVIKIAIGQGQIDDLTGTNKNPGVCVTRNNKPLFSKDLVVHRDTVTKVKPKDPANPIYGIKFTTSVYESVVHLEGTSIFNDIYFLPNQRLSKRSFLTTGKKTTNWTGRLYAPGYYFYNNDMYVNLDNLADQGRNLLSIENTLMDPELTEAARSQFGLDKNPELRQLFLTDDSQLQFKNSITFVKGTRKVFTSLEPLTHPDNSRTIPYEEYLVKMGDFGNTKNINFYEFQLKKTNVTNSKQLINFDSNFKFEQGKAHNVAVKDWVYKPNINETVEFTTTTRQNKFVTAGPVASKDTNYSIQTVDEIDMLYDEFKPLWSIPNFSNTESYKAGDMVRLSSTAANESLRGKVFVFRSSQGPGILENRIEYLQVVNEPYLPNFFVNTYAKPNLQISNGANDYTPASWQVLQTTDNNVVISECCPGPTDTSKTLIETVKDHNLETGQRVLIINTEEDWGSVNGVWTVEKIDARSFYIPTRLTQKISKGKIFTFKPVRFENIADLQAALSGQQGYAWKPKLSTVESSLGMSQLRLQPTPSGYSQVMPLVIVDQVIADPEIDTSWDTGGYVSYQVNVAANGTTTLTEVKREELPVIANDIEHVIIYDYGTNNVVARVEVFDPSRFVLPSLFVGEIDAVKRVDPARYNRTSSEFKAVYSSTAWHSEQIGKRWWDTSTVKFTDYKIGSAIERSVKWAEMTTGSTIDIYEWVKSPVHPSQWQEYVSKGLEVFGEIASGSAYTEVVNGSKSYNWTEEEDYVNGQVVKTYYFWVRNKNSIKANSNRMLSTLQIAKTILNPSAAGIPWCAPLTKHTMMFVGIENLLTDTTVVQIKRKTKGSEKHQQWLFVADYNPAQTIPEYLHVRLRDSLAGAIFDEKFYGAPYNKIMYLERKVPDDRLHPYNRLGNSIRPYAQSWFNDLYEARRTFVKEANLILKNIDVINSKTGWLNHLNSNVPIGEELVDVTEMWNYTDYHAPDYDASKPVTLIVESEEKALTESIAMADGEYIKVVNSLLQSEVIYQVVSTEGIVPVWRKNGTIAFVELTKEMYNKRTWDGAPWDYYPWDEPWSLLFHCIVEALRRDIFIGEEQKFYNKITCVMFRQILSEQLYVDWLAKASTIQPYNLIGAELEQKVELERDSSNTLIGYFKNVKSFRDKLRDSVTTKNIQEPTDVILTDTHQLNVTLKYNRHSEGNLPEFTNIKGLNFVHMGWDDESSPWDIFNWDQNQTDNNQQLEKVYAGLSGIPAEVIAANISGTERSRFSRDNVGEELVNCYIGESSLRFDVEHYFDGIDATIKVRTFYHKLAVRHVMLIDDKAATLQQAVDNTTTTITLTPEDLAKLPEATLDKPQAFWIDNERIEYYVKTQTGVTKLIRASAGTSTADHAEGAKIYPETAETVLPSAKRFGENYTSGPYFSDTDKSLDLSSNAVVSILKNNAE